MPHVPAAMVATPRRRKMIAGVWVVAIVLDFLTTWVALTQRAGFAERSPIPAWAMQHIGVLPTITVGSLICVVVAVATYGWAGENRLYAAVQQAAACAAVLKLAVAMNNLRLLYLV